MSEKKLGGESTTGGSVLPFRRLWWLSPLSVAMVMALPPGLDTEGTAWAAAPADDYPEFTSSPRSGPPGTIITAQGSNCEGATDGEVSLRHSSQGAIATTSLNPTSLGQWSVTLPVPAHAAPGEYQLEALCAYERGTPNLFKENRFTVTPAPPTGAGARLSVSPASVPLGVRFTVRGTGCPSPGNAIAAVNKDGREMEGAQVGNPNAKGNWTVRFTIPKGNSSSANYAVKATCYRDGDQVGFVYRDQPFDVTKGPSRRSGERSVEPPAPPTGPVPVTEPIDEAAARADEEPGPSALPWLLAAGGTAMGLAAIPVIRRLRSR